MRIVILLFLFLFGCAEGSKTRGIQIGVDPNWYPIDFGPQLSYVNGFTEELLLEIATATQTDYVRQAGNADALLSGLQSGKYDAVIASIPPYNFNLAKYEFSQNFLDLGPVLIVPIDSSYTDISQLNGLLVGVVANDQTVLALDRYDEIVVRSYPSIPELLNQVINGEIEGAILYRLPASRYIRDQYFEQLKIVGKPLTQEGLHLVTIKGRNPQVIKTFDKALDSIKKKRLEDLLKKWQLD